MKRIGQPRPNITKASCLQRWGTTPPHFQPPCRPGLSPRHLECPFPVNEEINNRICIWEGDITMLEADAIIAATNEYEPPRRSFAERVFQRSRPREEPQGVPEVGEVKISEEPCVVANYLLYTVAPKFRQRNRTVSDFELHIAYKNVLERARQLGLNSLGLGLLHSARKNYPPHYGAHIGLRTLRRFLEHYPDAFDVVVLVVDAFTHGLYERILPLYFPRSAIEEEAACWRLPGPIGGLWGEPITEQGEMRIIENPQNVFEDDDHEGGTSGSRQYIGEHPFAKMESDVDTERLLGGRQPTYMTGDPILDLIMKDFEKRGRYERMLRQARNVDLSEISQLGCVYQSGTDRLGRPVVIFIGRWFRARETDHNKFFLYLISLMDSIVNNEYVIIYFHTKTSNENRPGMNWFTSMYNVLPYKYKKNLKAVYVVHPSFWTKSLTWWFAKFLAPSIRQKIHTITGIEYLYNVMVPRDLEIPAFITEYDMTVNGVHYYKPKHIESSEQGDFEAIAAATALRLLESEPQPSTSGTTSALEPRPSTSGLGSSKGEVRPSTSGTSTTEILPSTSEVETSTWELRQSKSGFRFTKLEPRSSKSQSEPSAASQARQSGSSSERGKEEPQPGLSTSQAGSSTSELKQKSSKSRPGPAKPDPEMDPWKVLLSPSSSEVSLPTLQSELPPDRSKSRVKPDPWGLIPSPATSEPDLAAMDPKTMPSTSKTTQPPSKPPSSKTTQPPSKPSSSKSTTSSKKKGDRKKRSSGSEIASTLL